MRLLFWIPATLSAVLFLQATPSSQAAELELVSPAKPNTDPKTQWFDLQAIGVEGKGWTDTASFFDRLPARAKEIVRPPVWSLSQHSAGIAARFVTDAQSIAVRWTLRLERLAMPHMAATGVSGVDLYVKTESGTWRWLAIGRPTKKTNRETLISGIPKGTREYCLYLPLYNGVESVAVGIPKASKLWKAPAREKGKAKPLVFWGTSITHGACASRPGMVHTAILGRRLNRPVINLGFSGNGRLEAEVAKLIAELDAALFIIDCLPNVEAATIREKTEPVVRILRASHPKTPILLVEDRTYPIAFLKPDRRARNETSRAAFRAAYERLTKAGVSNLHYLDGDLLLGQDGDDTVDGSHPTDLGFYRQANAFEKVLRPLLEQP